MNKLPILTASALIALLSFSGCKTMNFDGPNWINQIERPRLLSPLNMAGKQKEELMGTAQKMAVIWKDTVMQKPGSPITRGFGGRIYFYDNENKAIKVNGEMIVYGFDSESGKSEADKKFVFRDSELQGHYGKTDLGHSYSFWIPWDENGSPRMAVTLIPIFKNSDGTVVKGGQTINVLPGPEPKNHRQESSGHRGTFIGQSGQSGHSENVNGSEIQLTGAEEPYPDTLHSGIVQEDRSTRIRTTTIQLPKNIAQRLATSPPPVTGPVNTVKTTTRSIGVADTTVDLRQQPGELERVGPPEPPAPAATSAPVPAKRKPQVRRPYPEFGKAMLEDGDEVRVFGKPQPFH